MPTVLVWEDWDSPKWRVNNIYTIIDDEGKEVPFRMRSEQEEFYDNLWNWNLILKARQLGFSTVVALMALDQCIFSNDFTAGIIAHNLDDASKIFRNKVKTPYERLPQSLRDAAALRKANESELVFENGSSMAVSTSMRSGTLQMLHISEFGKLCAKWPDKAKEIVTGSFPTLKAGQILIIESTSEGQGGYFHDYCMGAMKAKQEGKKEGPLDFRLHFFPWWRKEANRIDPVGVVIEPHMKKYFMELETKHHVPLLTDSQKAWYVKTEHLMMGDMGREHPSYPEEAFEQSIDGAYFSNEMAWLRRNNRLMPVPYEPSVPVNTFWDFGVDDSTSIWFHQQIGMQNRLIGYYENSGEGLAHYVNVMNAKGFVYGTHYIPHDGDHRIQGEHITTKRDILNGLGVKNTYTVPRIPEKGDAIEMLRQFLKSCWIDNSGECAMGIKCLDNYRKEWNEKLAVWRGTPLHNWASHGADAAMTGAQGFKAKVIAGASTFQRHRDSPRA